VSFFYPDVSHYQPNYVITAQHPVVFAKATEGTAYQDPRYATFRGQAARAGVHFGAYHWLRPDNPAGQARFAFGTVGAGTPLMLDCEHKAPLLTVGEIADFVDAYRSAGGRTHLVYLPHWYWASMGRPNLRLLLDRGLLLVASEYRTYDEQRWPGGYGGMVPYVWQFTNNYFGSGVDFNACRDTPEQFISKIFGIGGADVATLEGTQAVQLKNTETMLGAMRDLAAPQLDASDGKGIRPFPSPFAETVKRIDAATAATRARVDELASSPRVVVDPITLADSLSDSQLATIGQAMADRFFARLAELGDPPK
jgi:hypothetical protein